MKKLLLIFSIILSVPSLAQTWQDTLQKLDKVFEIYNNVPGAQLAISRNGQTIFSKAWGLADMEHDVPLTTNSLTEAGSISKQFVAACMLILEQQGKLSLEDDVRKYLPELPDYGTTIKLRHMMQHTSGIKDWGAVVAVTGWPRSTKTYDNNDALHVVSKQTTLNNVPGAEYIYSNSNYNLFALIIQRVSGMSLAEFSRKFIFDPAGMKQSQWRDDYKRIVKNRAIAYSGAGKGYQTEMPNEYVYGNGGLLTNAEELLQWTNYYQSGKLGTPSLLQKQLYSNLLLNGNKNSYAAGLFIQKTNGVTDITHNGATAGYRADMHYFPESGLAIAWMSNNSKLPMEIVNEVINLFIPKPAAEPKVISPEVVVDPAILSSYAHWYQNQRSGDGLEVTLKDNNLVMQNQKIFAASNTHFIIGQNAIDFNKNGLAIVTAANDTVYFNSVDKPDVSPASLEQYAGLYTSGETESTLQIEVVKGKLVLRPRPSNDIPLTPTYKDGFTSPAGIVYFQRDKKGKIVGLKVSVSRARNIVFTKSIF